MPNDKVLPENMTLEQIIHDNSVRILLTRVMKEAAENGYVPYWNDFWAVANRRFLLVDWCDPDTSYEEDMKAFYYAFKDQLTKLM